MCKEAAGGEAAGAKQEGFHLSNQELELYPEGYGSHQRILGREVFVILNLIWWSQRIEIQEWGLKQEVC